MDSRDQALARLRASYVTGDLSFDEFSEGVDGVLSARTQTEIDALVARLPQTVPALVHADHEVVRRHLLPDERVLWGGQT